MESWLQRRLSRISLRELNFYTIVFILLLTVIFSSLLIYDEYQQFSHDSYSAAANAVGGDHKLKGQLIKVMVEIATLALILFGFIVGISKIVNSMIARDMERFLTFFESAHEKEMCILSNDLYFNEFKKMAVYANEMAAMIYDQKESLRALNASLEERVKEKTAALEVKNFALEEEKGFSQELLAAQKQFIRYAIHETNTPLSVIMTNIELYTMNEGRNRYLAKIEAAVKNIFSIYDDLGYLVKKDQVDYPKRHIDVEEYVSSRMYFFDEVAGHAGLSFEFISECSGCVIEFNETKLQRIVDNNLTNAIKYTQPGETIRVGLVAEADAIRFWVESRSQRILDTHKIFDAYYRERKKTDGFGLGLNLVKSICDEEGVKIAITSDDEMTRFEYWFAKGVS